MDSTWCDFGFMSLIRDHMYIINSMPGTKTIEIPNGVVQHGAGDAFTVLNQLDLPQDMWFAILCVNNINAPSEFDTHINQLVIPDFKYITELHSIYVSGVT